VGAVIAKAEIEGVRVYPLKRIGDERGMVMHMLRADAPHFEGFGEVYFSSVRPGVVKAWKRHRLMTQNFAVPVGEIKLVIYDDREGSVSRGAVQEVAVGGKNYALVRVPPMLWYGFKGMAREDSLLANCASIPHDPAEAESIAPDSDRIPYSWRI
jgi:dTDP-4-dehydrorhamnose 3,5-epimerase